MDFFEDFSKELRQVVGLPEASILMMDFPIKVASVDMDKMENESLRRMGPRGRYDPW